MATTSVFSSGNSHGQRAWWARVHRVAKSWKQLSMHARKQGDKNNASYSLCFPCSSIGKESACSAGDRGLIPGLGGPPGEGNGNLLQYPCLGNLMDRAVWWAVAHGVAKIQA